MSKNAKNDDFFHEPSVVLFIPGSNHPSKKEEGEGEDKIKDKSQMDSRTELKACIIKSSSYAPSSF